MLVAVQKQGVCVYCEPTSGVWEPIVYVVTDCNVKKLTIQVYCFCPWRNSP